jgi:hypothetical protein
MSETKTIARRGASGTQFPRQPAPVSSRDETYRDPAEKRTLYVLGFGVLGAIVADTIVLIFFSTFYTSG